MPNTPENDPSAELCTMDHLPCRSAYRHEVYDNARRCKRVTTKRCKQNPTKKKMCETAKRGISRLRKKELCSYIVGNPAFRTEGQFFKKDFMGTPSLRKELTESVQREFFTPMRLDMTDRKKGSIGDAQRVLYLARFSGPQSTVYSERGGGKAYWTNYDEDEEELLDDWELLFPEHFESFVRSAKRKGIENVFIYMRLFMRMPEKPEEDSKHSNFLLLDLVNGLMYRYEPSGYGLYSVFEMDRLDEALTVWARKRNLKYIPPWDSCPTQLFAKVAALQRMAGKAEKDASDPGGFCKVWSTFMLEQKLRHPQMSMNDLQKQLLKVFKDNNIDLTYFARAYIERVNQYGNSILQKHKMQYKDKDKDKDKDNDKDNDKDKDNDNTDLEEYLEKHWNVLIQMAVKGK